MQISFIHSTNSECGNIQSTWTFICPFAHSIQDLQTLAGLVPITASDVGSARSCLNSNQIIRNSQLEKLIYSYLFIY